MLRILFIALLLGLIPALANADPAPQRQEYRIEIKLYTGELLLQEIPLQFVAGMTTGRTGGTAHGASPEEARQGPKQISYVVYSDDKGEHSGFRQLPSDAINKAAMDQAQHFAVDNFNLYIFMPAADRFEAVIMERPAPANSFNPAKPHLPANDYGEKGDLAGFEKTGWLSGSLRPVASLSESIGSAQ